MKKIKSMHKGTKKILKKIAPLILINFYSDLRERYQYRVYKKMVCEVKFPIKKEKIKILDLGGGNGLFSSILFKHFNGKGYSVEILVVDKYSSKLRKKLNSKYPFLIFSKGDAENLEFGEDFFDLVICKDVLHHCNNPTKAIKEIKRVGKKFIIIESRRGDKYLDKYLKNHHHFTLEKFKKLVKPKKISFVDIMWPKSKIIMFLLSFLPNLPKSKNAFMVGKNF